MRGGEETPPAAYPRQMNATQTFADAVPAMPRTASSPPAPGMTKDIAPGVKWLRIGLPMALDHINLWALADGPGWTIVDSGISHPATIHAWERILAEDLEGRPVTRVIVTHMHGDHAGLAGWLVERFGCELWMTRTEYLMAQTLANATGTEVSFHDLHHKAGWDDEEIAGLAARKRAIAQFYWPLPTSIRRIHDGDRLEIGDQTWAVITGGGHSPEHACLHCAELGLLISGDMVLPNISSNISVEPAEPDSDPLAEWFATLERIRRKVPTQVMVLPSHGSCFHGLHARIDQLVGGQRDALQRLTEAIGRPKRVDELFSVLFSRPILRSDIPLMGLATGETLALLNHLISEGLAQKASGDRGIMHYQGTGQSGA